MSFLTDTEGGRGRGAPDSTLAKLWQWRGESAVIFLVAVALLTLGVWDEAPVGFDARWALFLQDMFYNGPGLFPRTYGQPYPDYPASATLLSYGFARLFGEPNQLANILPTALASAGVLALLYRLLAPYSRRWALLSVVLTALVSQWLDKSRAVCLDQMIALICLGCFYLLHSAETRGLSWRRPGVFLLFALGFMIRGPLGLVEPCGVVCVYCLLAADRAPGAWSRALRRVLVYGLGGVAIMAACWWLQIQMALISGGQAFADAVWRMQIASRIADATGKPFYLYLQLSLYRFLPVMPLAAATLWVLRRRWFAATGSPEERLCRLLAGFGLVILVGLSIPHFKLPYYVLPMIAPLAAVAAYGMLNAQGALLRWRSGFAWVLLVLPLLCVLGVLVGRHLWRANGHWPDLPLGWILLTLGLLQLAAVMLWRRLGSRVEQRLVGLAIVAMLAQWLVLVGVVQPMQAHRFDTRGFVAQVEALRQQRPGPLVFANRGRDAWVIRYLMNLRHDERPIFIEANHPQALVSLPRPYWVILTPEDDDLARLPPLAGRTPTYIGRLNDIRCRVYRVD